MDPYDMKELRGQTIKPLLAGLRATKGTHLFFRTAHKFLELREPVVKFVAKSCGSAVFKKNIRNTYKDHSDVLNIVKDLLDV